LLWLLADGGSNLSSAERIYINQQEEIRKTLILREPMTWMENGACRGVDADQFFPEKGSAGAHYKVVIEDFCNVCSVKESCLNFALDNYELGIWGGTTARKRKDLRSQRNKQ
jgi:hypothetical protein